MSSHVPLAERHIDARRIGRPAAGQPLNRRGPVVVADDVERLLVGRDAHAVGLAGVGDDPLYLAVRVDAIDADHRLVDRFVAEVSRIAEVDASLLVDRDVIGGS